MKNEFQRKLTYSAIAFNLTNIKPLSFYKIPIVLHEEFLPKIDSNILKNFIPTEKVELLKQISINRVECEIEKCLKRKVKIISFFDSIYPQNLRNIPDPPPVLYLSGKEITNLPKLSIIGPRRPTSYGEAVTNYFIDHLSKYEIETVSGLALGIDALTHKRSIELNINTIAILGTGIDVPYPRSNFSIYESLKTNGTIISEFPLGTEGLKLNFPRRNRIIAALSFGTLVIEATPKSGSLITAQFALDFGKEVFAVPGNIFNFQSQGTNELILNGAIPVTDINDILMCRNIPLTTRRANNKPNKTSHNTLFSKIPPELLKELINFLVKPKTFDNIIDFCNKKNYTFTSSILTLMEIEGLIKVEQNLIYKAGNQIGKKFSNC